MRSWVRDLGWVVLLNLPGLFLLAHFPQGPDGAEMMTTAVFGGVMHPSGMPLQAWLNRLAVGVSPDHAGWILSFVSWSGHVLACLLLCRTLRLFGVRGFALGLAVAAYLSHGMVGALALQSEKYAWSAATIFFVLWSLAKVLEHGRPKDLQVLALALALAISQHSANAIYLSFLLAGVAAFWLRSPRSILLRQLLLVALTVVGVTAAFYLSLLQLRSSRPWPDWGNLRTVHDVWRHFARRDFANGLLNPPSAPVVGEVRPLLLFLGDLLPWNLLLLCIPFGGWVLYRRSKLYFGASLTALAAGFAVLCVARLATDNLDLGRGYGERYQMLIVPLVALLLGIGLQEILVRAGQRLILVRTAGLVALVGALFLNAPRFIAVDNNLVDIYRRQAGRELPPNPFFLSTDETDLFYGLPCGDRVCFPLKNLFGTPWYREHTALAMEPRVAALLRQKPLNYTQFIEMAVRSGLPVASTTGGVLVTDPLLQGHLEQTGLVWIASFHPRPLYTKSIFDNALSLCGELNSVWRDVPVRGAEFNAEILSRFHYVFRGASDAYEGQAQSTLAKAANAVAEVLHPGSSHLSWADKCREFIALAK